MLKYSKSYGFTQAARMLLVAFVHPLFAAPFLLSAPRAAEGADTSKFAVLPFECARTLGGDAFGESAAKAMALALIERNGYQVAGLQDVKKALADARITPPYIAEDMQRIGSTLGVDRVIRGRVTAASVTGAPKLAIVEVTTKTLAVDAGAIVHETRARGRARSYNGRSKDDDLKAEALKDAARQSVAQLTTIKDLGGIVVSRPEEYTARLSAGTQAGLQPGARVGLYEKGKKVAEGTVTDVAPADAVVKIDPPEDAKGVRIGQQFRAISTPGVSEAETVQVDELSPKARRKSKSNFFWGLLVAAGLYLLLRNDDNPAPTVAGTVTGMTLVSNSPTIAADGISTAGITVTARDANGNPVPDGSTIAFTTTLGTVTATATTSAGQASATLIAGTVPGTAVVTATLGAISQTTSVQFTSTATSPVTMSAASPSIPAGGASATNITATFRDANNNTVPDGSVVQWSTQLGTLGPARSRGGRQSTFTTTTVNGTTSVSLTSGVTPGTAVVTAQLQGTNTKSTITITFTTFSVQVVANPQTIIADGNSISTLTATLTDSAGSPVPDGTVVNFITTLGTVTASAVTANGQATATLTSGTVAGTARVTVQVLNDQGQVIATADATNVGFSAGPAAQLGVGTASLNVAALHTVGATNNVIVSVKDANGNPVRDGTVIAFRSDKGHVTGNAVTQNGVATATWTSIVTDHSNPPAGIVTITASTTTQGGGQVSSTTSFIVSGPPTSITFTSIAPANIPAKTANSEGGKSIVTVDVRDENNNFVIAGTQISFVSTLGTVSGSSTTTDGVNASIATATVTAGDVTGTATITAKSGFAQGTGTLTIF